jgi:putative protease
VAYSGQCLTSEALGQRSANRGECAQACRLPYALIVDGEARDLGNQRFLLSPQDLAAWELLPQLSRLGIASLKIEGRLKDAHYVAAVTDAYRQSLDRLAEGVEPGPLPVEQRRSLELSFSRGLSTGWLEGVDHRQLVHGRWSKKRGPLVGTLQAVERGGWWVLRTDDVLKPGDGLVLEAPASHDPLAAPLEVGGRVMAVERRSPGLLAIRLGPGRLPTSTLPAGSGCWLTSDPALEKQWHQLAQRPVPERPRILRLAVSGRDGSPLVVRVLSAEGLADAQLVDLQVRSEPMLEPARGAALDRERLLAQLGRLGGTAWQLDDLTMELEGDLFLPVGELNRLRRSLVHLLAERHTAPASPAECRTLPVAEIIRELSPSPISLQPSPPQLVVVVRRLEQLAALRGLPLHSVVADLEQPQQLREAVAMGRGCWDAGIWLAGARITRPDEAWSLEPLLRASPDGYLVRNADQLERLSGIAPCAGDFSLNVANPLSLAWFLDHWGLQRVCASYDLDLEQLEPLLRAAPRDRLEVTVHQHMPLFHMEHCLFCAFLSDGHDHTDCGRPCEQHTVLLRDRSGAEHPLHADIGCRNTLFNARAQSAAEAIPHLLANGASLLRVELLEEDGYQARHRVELYLQVMAGRLDGRELWQREQLDSRLGVTRGTLKPRTVEGRSNSGIV